MNVTSSFGGAGFCKGLMLLESAEGMSVEYFVMKRSDHDCAGAWQQRMTKFSQSLPQCNFFWLGIITKIPFCFVFS